MASCYVNKYKIVMKNLAFLFLFGWAACQSPQTPEDQVDLSAVQVSETEGVAAEKALRHVVLFKFKETASEADIKSVEDAFAALPAKIPEIKDFEWGTNNSPEGLDKGFTHCFLLTFDSDEGRATYLPHPDHKLFGEALSPHLEDVLVVDYWN